MTKSEGHAGTPLANDLRRTMKEARISFLLAFAKRITDKLRGDSRIGSIWVSGSLARGEADEFSDLDMAALIEKDRLSQFMEENRREMWLSIGAEGWPDRWGDKCITNKVPFSVDYLTLDRILNCGWDELEHSEMVLAGFVYSKPTYDPLGTLEKLKKQFSVYPEQLRKRRILQIDDDVSMYAYLAEIEIKRKDYVKAAYLLRDAARELVYLQFPLNGRYFVSKRHLLDRLRKLDRVPRELPEQYLSTLFDMKPDEVSMNSSLKSINTILENLRKDFDYLKWRNEFPMWASRKS